MRLDLGLLRRSPLRVRFILTFAGLTVLVTAVLGLATFFTVRTLLERQRVDASTRQTGFALLFAREFLAGHPGQDRALVDLLRTRERFDAMVVSNGASFSTSLALTPDEVPDGLAGLVDGGRVGYQVGPVAGARMLIFGAPIGGGRALFLFYSLADLDRTMSVLTRVLAVAGVVVAIAAVLVARRLTQRVLQPLTAVTGAATRIAEGLLETRVEAVSEDEVGALATSFNRMAEAVTDMIGRERRFTAAVSHELRTPLADLQATSDLLVSGREALSPAGREAVDLVVEDVANLRRLVEDLLEVSELDAGSARVRWEQVELRTLIETQLKRMRRAVPVSGPSVQTYADKARVARVVSNLVENAFEHGDGQEVSIGVAQEGEACTVAVRDRGPGLESEETDRIFAPFYKADNSRTRERGGVGLGLAIASANARLLGGTIEVTSEPGAGATFTLRLPIRSGPPEAGR